MDSPSSAGTWSSSGSAGLSQEPATDDILLDDSDDGRQRSGTEVLGAEFVNYEVDSSPHTDPYTAPEPLVSTYSERVARDRKPSSLRGSAFRSTKSRRYSSSSLRDGDRESYVGEFIALGFAAAVGIGCGFMFLKLFAPSLLAKWHF
jgi:hypothetical protein